MSVTITEDSVEIAFRIQKQCLAWFYPDPLLFAAVGIYCRLPSLPLKYNPPHWGRFDGHEPEPTPPARSPELSSRLWAKGWRRLSLESRQKWKWARVLLKTSSCESEQLWSRLHAEGGRLIKGTSGRVSVRPRVLLGIPDMLQLWPAGCSSEPAAVRAPHSTGEDGESRKWSR